VKYNGLAPLISGDFSIAKNLTWLETMQISIGGANFTLPFAFFPNLIELDISNANKITWNQTDMLSSWFPSLRDLYISSATFTNDVPFVGKFFFFASKKK
jgi:hypothetical protein